MKLEKLCFRALFFESFKQQSVFNSCSFFLRGQKTTRPKQNGNKNDDNSFNNGNNYSNLSQKYIQIPNRYRTNCPHFVISDADDLIVDIYMDGIHTFTQKTDLN